MSRARHMQDEFYGSQTVAGPLFEQRDPGPFALSRAQASPDELLIAGLIWKHKGRANPISLARLRELTNFSERHIKSVVEQLVVTHRIRIGARREEPVGYFVIVDAEDQLTAARTFRNQILAMWRRLKVIDDRRSLVEFLGQLNLGENHDNDTRSDIDEAQPERDAGSSRSDGSRS